jgi:hypothetical protein
MCLDFNTIPDKTTWALSGIENKDFLKIPKTEYFNYSSSFLTSSFLTSAFLTSTF